jgi:uncharacterized protein YkwD
MGKTFLRFLVAVAALAGSGSAQAEQYAALLSRLLAQGQAQNMFQPTVEARLQALLNAYRVAHGKPPLADDAALKSAARGHAADMALHNFMGHTASSGHDFDSRMHALRPGVMVLPAMGENAAMRPAGGAADALAQQLFQAWLNSPPHLHTLMSRDYLRVATGVAVFGGKAYADEIFVGPEVHTNMNMGGGN